MTLAQIKLLALRQLDEDPQDISEYDDVFRAYANMGYHIAVSEYLRPRETYAIQTDKDGRAQMPGTNEARIAEITDEEGRAVCFEIEADGKTLRTGKRDKRLSAVCEILHPPMEEETDEPRLPAAAHPALADYICYRYLSSGNLAKQSRAQFFLNSFYQQMRAIRPQGMGSVTRERNLYAVSDVRYMR